MRFGATKLKCVFLRKVEMSHLVLRERGLAFIWDTQQWRQPLQSPSYPKIG